MNVDQSTIDAYDHTHFQSTVYREKLGKFGILNKKQNAIETSKQWGLLIGSDWSVVVEITTPSYDFLSLVLEYIFEMEINKSQIQPENMTEQENSMQLQFFSLFDNKRNCNKLIKSACNNKLYKIRNLFIMFNNKSTISKNFGFKLSNS